MTDYDPPLVNLPIFDKLVFINPDDYITQSQADKRYLKFPNAQGTENLQTTNINGVLTVNSTSNFNNIINMSSITPNERRIYASYYNLKDINGNVSRTSEIYQNSQILTLTNETISGRTRFINSNAGGTPTSTFEIDTTVATLYTPLTITANNNLTMSSGNGIISQSIVSGDISSTNNMKRTQLSINTGSTSGSGNSVLDILDTQTNKGLFFLCNSGNNSLSNTNRLGDVVIGTRNENAGCLTLSNYNTNLRNGIRIYTLDTNSAGVQIQCGQHSTNDYTEFVMNYARGTNTTTTTFNNVINFNPTTPSAINSTRRALIGLGTLSFTDNLNGGSTGITTSSIYTDSTVVSNISGMYYNTNINGGSHIFKSNDSGGTNSTSLLLNSELNTSYNRVYQELNPNWSRVNGYYELAKDAYPTLNPISTGTTAVTTWTTRITSIDLSYYSIAWAPELMLFCAVAETGSGGTGIDRVITSPDGITWTQRNCFAQGWRYVIWAPEIKTFVASCITGTTTQRIMTSSDGINWALRTTPNDNNWRGIAWSPELSLLVCVADTGLTDRVMTSPDGVVWTARSVSTGNWQGVCWSAELGIFVAVGSALTGTRVMTSPDGTTWTLRNSAADNTWRNVVWASEIGLFVAVASSGTNNRVMTSTNGINWTSRTTTNNGYRDITWSPELKLFCAVADSGSSNLVMTSSDGINWITRTTNNNIWLGVCWSPELGIFCSCAASGTNDRIMTSSLQGRPPTNFNVFKNGVYNSIDETGTWTLTSNIIYSPTVEIRRNTTTPLSRLEIVNDGANSSYIKSRAPTGQSVLFLNTYNGVSDDETMNVSSTRIQVRRPIQFSYLTTPSAATQLGFQTGPTNIGSSAFSSATTERNFSSFTIVNAGMYNVSVTLMLSGNANHTLTEWRYCLDGTSATFPSTSTPTKFTMSIRGNPPVNLDTSTTSYFNTTFNVLATANEIYYINFKMVFAGGGTTNIGAVYSYTRIG